MIKLDTTTCKLQILLAGSVASNALPVYVSYADQTATTYLGAKQRSTVNSATPVDICAAPLAGAVRDIDYLSISNLDTAPVTMTVRVNDSGVMTVLYTCTLDVGERLEYGHGTGFRAMASNGAVKSGAVQDLSGYQLVNAKDVSNGYVGLTGLAINFKNLLGTVVSLFQNANTLVRTYTFPDKSGTVAMTSDVVTDHTGLANIGTNTHAQIDTHIANTSNPHSVTKTQVGLPNVDNTSDVNKPVSTAQAAADTAVLNAAQTYADGLVVGLWDDRGNFSASGNAWPTTGGSGSAGAIKKGDTWTISVTGTLGGHIVDVGDVIRALVDAPGSTDSNWAIQEHNLGYTAENSANKDTSGGYAGLTALKLNLRNVANTITSWFTNANTVARTYTLPDKDGTVAMTSDITGTNSGTNTGDQTITLTGGVTGSGTGSFVATVVTNANLTGDVTSVGNATTLATANGSPGTFTNATVTVDGKGRVTAASTGAGGGGAGLTTNTFTGAQTVSEAVGATSTDGVNLVTTTAATAGVQSFSPRIRWLSKGWATTPVASQNIEFSIDAQPLQGAANPSGFLVVQSSVNGGGFANPIVFDSAGAIRLAPSLSNNGGTYLWSPGSGQLKVGNGNAGADGQVHAARFIDGSNQFALDNLGFAGLGFANTFKIFWSSTAAWSGTADLGIARNAAGVAEVNNGSASAFRDLALRCLRPQVFTVATLPSAATQGNGARSHVSDAAAPAFGATVAGSGAVSTPVYSDSSLWKVG